MNKSPLVSICIPVYNGESFLEECLESILKQSFRNFEVIVVDDQSSDASFEIAQRFRDRGDRIHVVRNEVNLGLVENWNRCLELSRGEWIKYVFQDDMIDPDCLEKMIKAAEFSNGMIVSRRRIVFNTVSQEVKKIYDDFSGNKSIDAIFPGRTHIAPNDLCYAVFNKPGCNFIGEPTAVMIHRDVFRKFGRFNPKFIQLCDLELLLRIGCNLGFHYVPETLATFRVHPESTSMTNRNEQKFRMEICDLLQLYLEFVYNEHFKKMRDIAENRRPRIYLERMLALEAVRARLIMKRNLDVSDKMDPRVMDILNSCPMIENRLLALLLAILGPLILKRLTSMYLFRFVFGKIPFKMRRQTV
ncbi:MAG: glycosyltransferase [Desulfobacterales bacterium]|nr:glycosyltransferase [Desulfobacterales bacterium]